MYDDVERILVSRQEIEQMVKRLGDRISKDYAGKELVVLCVLKGGFVFMADLIREITVPLELDFIAVSSYGASTKSSGVVQLVKDSDIVITGKHVLIVEDIVDSGLTLSYLKNLLQTRGPLSIKICTAFDKPERRKVDLHADYYGITIPDEYVVGYGLDYDSRMRNIPELCVLKRSIYEK